MGANTVFTEDDWRNCSSIPGMLSMLDGLLWSYSHRAVVELAIHVANGVLRDVPLLDRRPRQSLAIAKARARSLSRDEDTNYEASEEVRRVIEEYAQKIGKDELPPSLSTAFWACATLGSKFIDSCESCLECAAMAIGSGKVCDLVREAVQWHDAKAALEAAAARRDYLLGISTERDPSAA